MDSFDHTFNQVRDNNQELLTKTIHKYAASEEDARCTLRRNKNSFHDRVYRYFPVKKNENSSQQFFEDRIENSKKIFSQIIKESTSNKIQHCNKKIASPSPVYVLPEDNSKCENEIIFLIREPDIKTLSSKLNVDFNVLKNHISEILQNKTFQNDTIFEQSTYSEKLGNMSPIGSVFTYSPLAINQTVFDKEIDFILQGLEKDNLDSRKSVSTQTIESNSVGTQTTPISPQNSDYYNKSTVITTPIDSAKSESFNNVIRLSKNHELKTIPHIQYPRKMVTNHNIDIIQDISTDKINNKETTYEEQLPEVDKFVSISYSKLSVNNKLLYNHSPDLFSDIDDDDYFSSINYKT